MKKSRLLNFIYRSKLFRVNHFLIRNNFNNEEYKIHEIVNDLRFINYYNINKLNESIRTGVNYGN